MPLPQFPISRTTALAAFIGAALGGGGRYLQNDAPESVRNIAESSHAPLPETSGRRSRPGISADPNEDGLDTALLSLQWLEKATAAECAAAAPLFASGIETLNIDQRRWIFYRRWAELDPRAAAEFCHTQGNVDLAVILEVWGRTSFADAWAVASAVPEKDRQAACLAALKGLAAVDPQRAWTLLQAENSLSGPVSSRMELLAIMAASDPAAAAALIPPSVDTLDDDSLTFKRIYGAWVDRDLPAAWAAASGSNSGGELNIAQRAVLQRIIDHDVSTAREFLSTLPAEISDKWVAYLAETYARQDPAGARMWAEKLPPGEGRTRAMGGVAVALARSSHPEDALPVFAAMGWKVEEQRTELIGQVNDEPIGLALSDALIALGRLDPTAAFKQCSELLEFDGDLGSGAGWEIASEWAGHDPEAALRAVAALPEDTKDYRYTLLRGVFERWSKEDFSAAWTAAEALPEGGLKKSAEQIVVSGLVETDPQRALEWSLAHDGDQRSEFIGLAFQEMIKQNPESAQATLETLEISSETRRALAGSVANHFAEENDSAAALEILVKENITGKILGKSLTRYLYRDPTAASEWVKALPAGEFRDLSIVTLAKFLRDQHQPDFEASFLWAQTMQGSEKRDNALLETLRNWEKRQPGASRHALESSLLPPAERARLLGILAKPLTEKQSPNDPFGE